MKKWERYYEEYYCRVLVEQFLKEFKFIKSESPDWVDTLNGIGMECAIAQVNEIYATSLKYAEYIHGKCRNPENRLKELNKRGKATKWGYLHQMTDENALPYIQSELEKKLIKLRDSYQKYDENWIAFYLESPISESEIEEFYQGLVQTQQEYETGFDKIIICGSQLFVFDMNSKYWQYYTLENQRSFAEKVKEIAMKEEGEC